MKIKTKPEDQDLLDWIDKKAKTYRRTRGQQILWFLSRLKIVDNLAASTLIDKAFLFIKPTP